MTATEVRNAEVIHTTETRSSFEYRRPTVPKFTIDD
jgi:hypothetical protein